MRHPVVRLLASYVYDVRVFVVIFEVPPFDEFFFFLAVPTNLAPPGQSSCKMLLHAVGAHIGSFLEYKKKLVKSIHIMLLHFSAKYICDLTDLRPQDIFYTNKYLID